MKGGEEGAGQGERKEEGERGREGRERGRHRVYSNRTPAHVCSSVVFLSPSHPPLCLPSEPYSSQGLYSGGICLFRGLCKWPVPLEHQCTECCVSKGGRSEGGREGGREGRRGRGEGEEEEEEEEVNFKKGVGETRECEREGGREGNRRV